MLDINLGGVVNGVLAAWPVFVRQRSGHLVNTASAAGLLPPPMVAAYAASKGGVLALSQSLRAEGASLGVRVSALCPGAVDTPILDGAGAGGTPPPSGPTLTGREFMAVVGMKPDPADRIAAIALKGVARNRGVIVAPTRPPPAGASTACPPGSATPSVATSQPESTRSWPRRRRPRVSLRVPELADR